MNQKKSLYQISQDMQSLEELLFESDGDVTDEQAEAAIDEWLQENKESLNEKLDGYVAVMKQRDAMNGFRIDEARRVIEFANREASQTARMRQRLKNFLESQNMKSYETTFHKFTVANNGGKEPLMVPENWEKEPAAAPERFHKRKIELDTDAIRAEVAVITAQVLAMMTEEEALTLSESSFEARSLYISRHLAPRLPEADYQRYKELSGCAILPRGTHLRVR